MSPGAFGQPLPGEDDGEPVIPPRPTGRFRDVTDPWDHPEAREFADHVRDETIPALRGSTYGVGLLSGKEGADFDVRQAVEIGAMLLMGKPLILGVQPGAHVPDGLARAADEIVELDLDLDSEGAAASLQAAMKRLDERGLGGRS